MSADASPLTAPIARDDAVVVAPGRGKRRARLFLRYLVLTLLARGVLFPIYITVVNSLLPSGEIPARPPTFFPSHPLWGSYSDAWDTGHMGRYLVNSFVMTSIIVVGQVLTAILAGYAFAFLEFP